MEENIVCQKKMYGLCDYCNKQGRVLAEHLNNVLVNAYCKRCSPVEDEDDDL